MTILYVCVMVSLNRQNQYKAVRSCWKSQTFTKAPAQVKVLVMGVHKRWSIKSSTEFKTNGHMLRIIVLKTSPDLF